MKISQDAPGRQRRKPVKELERAILHIEDLVIELFHINEQTGIQIHKI